MSKYVSGWSYHPTGTHSTHGTHGMTTDFPGSELTEDEWRFGQAMERYKREHDRPFPTWLEVLNVAKDLGYRKSI